MAVSGDNHATLPAVGDIGPTVEPVNELADLVRPVLRDADLRFGQCERVYSNRQFSKHGYCHSRQAD